MRYVYQFKINQLKCVSHGCDDMSNDGLQTFVEEIYTGACSSAATFGVPSKFNWVKYGSRELVVKLSRIECYHCPWM